MAFELSVWTVALALTVLLNIGMAAIVATRRGEKGAYPLLGIFLADGVWALSVLFVRGFESEGLKILWHNVRFVGPTLSSFAVVVFALLYTGRERYVRRDYLLGLAIVPLFTNVLVWTGQWHDLVRTGYELSEASPLGIDISNGPWFYVHALYSYALSLTAQILFIHQWYALDSGTTRRTQAALFALGAFVTVVTSSVYVAGLTEVDFTPFAFLVSGAIYIYAIFRY